MVKRNKQNKTNMYLALLVGGLLVLSVVGLYNMFEEKVLPPTTAPPLPPSPGTRQFANINEVYNAVMIDGYQINDWKTDPYEWRYDPTASPTEASAELRVQFHIKDPRLFDAPLSAEYFSVGDVVHKAIGEKEFVLSKITNTASGYTDTITTENWLKMVGYLHEAGQDYFYMTYTEDEWITFTGSGLSFWWKTFKVDAIEIINRCGGTGAAGTAGTYDDISFGRWDDPVTSVNVIPADNDITQTAASNTTTVLTVPLSVDDTKGDWQIRPDEKILFYTVLSGTTSGDSITGASIAGNTITLQPYTSGSTTYHYGFIPLGSLKTGNLTITASFGTADADEYSKWYIIGGAKCANTGGTALDQGWIWVDKVKYDLGLSGTPVVNFAQWYNPTTATNRGMTFVDGEADTEAKWDTA